MKPAEPSVWESGGKRERSGDKHGSRVVQGRTWASVTIDRRMDSED